MNQEHPAGKPLPSGKGAVTKWSALWRAVFLHTGFRRVEILGMRKSRDIIIARHAAIMLAHEMAPHLAFSEIARLFQRDHSTIKHVRNTVAREIKAGFGPRLSAMSKIRAVLLAGDALQDAAVWKAQQSRLQIASNDNMSVLDAESKVRSRSACGYVDMNGAIICAP